MYEIMEMARKAFPFVIFGLAIWYLVNENKKGNSSGKGGSNNTGK